MSAAGKERRHLRRKHGDGYTLSLDLAGPYKCSKDAHQQKPRHAVIGVYDLPAVQAQVLSLIRGGVFKSFGAAPVCGSFSIAVRPAWRSSERPSGLPGLGAEAFAKVQTANNQNRWVGTALAV